MSSPRSIPTRPTPAAAADGGDGLVRISATTLIALHHGARSLPLKPTAIRARQSGAYLSPFKGRGMEFDEARPYVPGDDVRTLDWRVTARTGRPYTKLFREERERSVLVWVDLRRTMLFATRGAFKAVRAAQVAALIGWSALDHGDRLGGLFFAEGFHRELRPRRGHQSLLHLLDELATAPAWSATGPTDAGGASAALSEALSRLRRVSQPGSLLFLMSDFRGLDETGEAHLAQLARHCDLVLVPIHDPLEADLPPEGWFRVGDGEQLIDFDAGDPKLRHAYRHAHQQHQGRLATLARRQRMHLIPLTTSDDPLAVLQNGLGVRHP